MLNDKEEFFIIHNNINVFTPIKCGQILSYDDNNFANNGDTKFNSLTKLQNYMLQKPKLKNTTDNSLAFMSNFCDGKYVLNNLSEIIPKTGDNHKKLPSVYFRPEGPEEYKVKPGFIAGVYSCSNVMKPLLYIADPQRGREGITSLKEAIDLISNHVGDFRKKINIILATCLEIIQ